MDSIKAARERWMRGVYPTTDSGEHLVERRNDSFVLADAYCELFDNELITEEFATSVRSSDIMLEQRNDSEWVLRMFNGSHPLLIADVVTKAQVRALLLAMGVEG